MLAQKLILSYSSKILIKFFQLIGTVVVARFAGADVLGTVAYGLAYVSIFGFISDLGTGTAHIKLISDGEKPGNANATYIGIRLSLLMIMVLAVTAYYFISTQVFHFKFETDLQRRVVIYSMIILLLTQLVSAVNVFFNSAIQQARQDIPELIKVIINQVLKITVVLLGYGAVAIVLSNILAILLVTPIYIYLIRKLPIGRFDKKLAKKYISISLPLVVVTGINSFITFGDKLILEHFSNTQEVGYYVAGYKLSGLVLMIAGSVGLIFFPTFTGLINRKDFVGLNRHVAKFEGFSYAFILPFVLGLAIFSDLFVHFILGEEFRSSASILSIVTLALFIYTMIIPYGNIITGKGRFDQQAYLALIRGIIFLSSALIYIVYIIPNSPSLAMATSILTANLVHGILVIIHSKKLVPEIRVLGIYKTPIFGVIYSVIFYLIIMNGMSSMSYFGQLGLLVLYLVGYLFFGTIMRVISSDEWRSLKELLKLGKLVKYIKNEFKER